MTSPALARLGRFSISALPIGASTGCRRPASRRPSPKTPTDPPPSASTGVRMEKGDGQPIATSRRGRRRDAGSAR
jgi:hypothetical protein